MGIITTKKEGVASDVGFRVVNCTTNPWPNIAITIPDQVVFEGQCGGDTCPIHGIDGDFLGPVVIRYAVGDCYIPIYHQRFTVTGMPGKGAVGDVHLRICVSNY